MYEERASRSSDARNLYVARTYAYVAGGNQGLVIVDVEKPEQPLIDQVFNAGGAIHDTNDVKLGMTAASAFAYLADGSGGMRIVQLFAPSDNPNYLGFSPKPTPKLIATYRTAGRRWRFRKASIGIALWTRAGTKWRFSIAGGRGR